MMCHFNLDRAILNIHPDIGSGIIDLIRMAEYSSLAILRQ